MEIIKMKNTYKQLLLLAGLYFVISLFMGYFENEILELINIGLLLTFIIMFFILIVKKSFSVLQTFQSKYVKTSNYLYALGFVKYLQLVFFSILSELDNYDATMAQYHHMEYISPYADLLTLIAFALLVILIVALLWATYASFVKPYIKKEIKK